MPSLTRFPTFGRVDVAVRQHRGFGRLPKAAGRYVLVAGNRRVPAIPEMTTMVTSKTVMGFGSGPPGVPRLQARSVLIWG